MIEEELEQLRINHAQHKEERNTIYSKLENMKRVLTEDSPFKPANTDDFFPVRANFLIKIIEHVEELTNALEWYADQENHVVPVRKYYEGEPQYGKSEIDKDEGERARQALK